VGSREENASKQEIWSFGSDPIRTETPVFDLPAKRLQSLIFAAAGARLSQSFAEKLPGGQAWRTIRCMI
jgi:hypothetical protein